MTSMIGNQGLRGPTGKIGSKIPAGYKQGQLANFTPEQMQLFQSLFGNVGPDSYLSRLAGGDQDIFNQIEAPELRQFNEIQGGLASRFSGLGGPGSLSSRRSSGFQNTMTAAGSNFAQDLAAKRQGLQQSALRDLMSMSQSLLHESPYETYLQPKKKSFLQQLAGGALRAAPAAAGAYYGGPTGAQVGYQTGNAFAEGFGV